MVGNRTVQLTPAGKAKLEEELRVLVEVKMPELNARIQEASDGDVSDNAEYEGLKDELIMIEGRIRELEQTLERATIIEHEAGDGTVRLGSVVTLRSDDGEEETWTIVGPEEANTLDGSISTESPVGRALLGRKVGDSTQVKTPAGTITYTVVRVA